MAISNHEALGRGLALYTEAMGQFVKQRLVAAFPSTWWEDGVMKVLPDPKKRQLQNDMAKDPKEDRAEYLDPSILVQVITRHHSRFQDAFPNYRYTQSLLQQISEARNIWAHSLSSDLPGDDVHLALMAMKRLLVDAELPAAEEVEKLRQEVMGVTETPSRETAAVVEAAAPAQVAMSTTAIPYWWEVCEPHDGFKNPAQIDESRFAASLGRVFAGAASEEYLDPKAFLSQTYFTENLTQMVREVASRLSGGDGASVTEVQTPFGGGKTHALLTFYHLVNSPAEAMTIPAVREALGDFSIPDNARVLVFDGQEHGTDPVPMDNGVDAFTMWGYLTAQVSASLYQRLIMSSDGSGTSPGNLVLSQVLEEAAPCLILIDELVSYLVKLRFSNSRRTQNLYRNTVQFLQEILQLAGNIPGVCVLLSLPESRREFGGLDPQQLQHELSILEDDLQPRADRVVSKRTPVNDDEIYLLTGRRLFKRADPDAAQRVAQSYQEIYNKTPGQYDGTVRTADYLSQQVAAYPFHPELIDVLYKKWSTASDFPRTRAVLQLLANIVADQWTNRREAYTIQSGHVDLGRERIRTRIVSAAGSGGGYGAVVAADIIGGDAHADYQDQRRGEEYARYQISRGVATTLLVHSFGGQMRTGALPQELRLGTVAPNVGPEYVTEVLGSLEQSLWYVHREGELLKFQTRPNIYRVIAQTAENQSPQRVSDRLREELDRAAGSQAGFRVVVWAGTDGTISDTPEPTIAILDPTRYVVGGAEVSDSGNAKVDGVWDRMGGGFRTYRNSLILAAPDADLWSSTEDAVREVLAYEAVVSGNAVNQLSQAEKSDLASRRTDKQNSLSTSIVTAYRWVFYPEQSGLTSDSLPVPATAGDKIAGRVISRLSDQDYGTPKVLTRMSALYFNARVSPHLWQDESDALDLSEALRRFPQWTYLPILPNREGTLLSCIREGLSQGLWAVAIGDVASVTYRELLETPEDLDRFGTLFDGTASLVKGELRDFIREELHPTVESVAPIAPDGTAPEPEGSASTPVAPELPLPIPAPARRLAKVRLSLQDLDVTKTTNLQPYLFRVLQDQDALAAINISIEVTSSAGIPEDVLEDRIVEGLSQLGIEVRWEDG